MITHWVYAYVKLLCYLSYHSLQYEGIQQETKTFEQRKENKQEKKQAGDAFQCKRK